MAKYKIEFKKSALKELEKLPKNDIKAILNKIEVLAENPFSLDVKKLSSQEKYRARCGDYRILYYIQNDVLVVYIFKIGHRKDVYRLK